MVQSFLPSFTLQTMQLLTSATPLKRLPQNKMLLTSMYRTENYDRAVTHTANPRNSLDQTFCRV